MKPLSLAIVASICILMRGATAQDRSAIELGKSTTALVTVENSDRIGSAACIAAEGIFVTNAKVVTGAEADAKIKLIVNAGLESQQKIEAIVVRTDEKSDLAILKAKAGGNFSKLPLAPNGTAFETMSITAFGFPFGAALTLEEGQYPNVSVNVGRISALRQEKGALQLLQVDVQLNPGNSGGPVLNDKGELIGIVSFGIPGSDVNFLIPVEKLKTLLIQPIVDVRVPALTTQTLQSPQKVEVKLISIVESAPDPSVEFWLRVAGGKPEFFPLARSAAPGEANLFSGEIKQATAVAPTAMRCKAEFAKGKVEGKLASTKFRLDATEYALSDVVKLESKEGKTHATFADGKQVSGVAAGLEEIAVDVGGFGVKVNLANASSVNLEAASDAGQVDYIVVVKSKDKEIARTSSLPKTSDASGSGELANSSSGVSADAFAKSKQSPVKIYTGIKKKVSIPGTITDVVQAGAGRYLALLLKAQRKIAVLDLNTQSIAKIIPLSSDDVLVAGTMQHLVILDRSKYVIERWKLDGFRKETAIKSPITGVIAMASGHAANGPILVYRAWGESRLSRATFSLIDLMTLEELSQKPQNTNHFNTTNDIVHVRASASGQVFGMWCTTHSPQGIQTLTVTDRELAIRYEHDSAGLIAPSADGAHIFTGNRGVFTSGLKALGAQNVRRPQCVPTSHPRLYLTLPMEPAAQINLGAAPYVGMKPGIFQLDAETPLVELPELDLGKLSTQPIDWSANDFTLDKRLFFIMEANLLVSLPFEDNAVVVQPFDLRKELTSAETDYLFVSSSPNRSFKPGKPYSYQIEVESKQKGNTFTLTSGPEGMKVSPLGRLTWTPPEKYDQSKVEVIVSITNGSGQQIYEAFTIQREK